jgi:hypothetical protein
MPPKALLLLKVLADAEPVLTIAALAAFLRVRRQVDLPAMRDYLIVRTPWAVIMVLLLAMRLSSVSNTELDALYACYFYGYWAGQFLLAILLIRVILAALDRILWSFPGLLALRRIGYRWFLVAASLVTMPVLYTLIIAFMNPADRAALNWSRLGSAIGLVELLAAISVLTLGLKSGLSPRCRLFGILAGLSMEPAAELLFNWLQRLSLWTWSNLSYQIATDSTLILWIVYFLLPDRQGPMKEPSERMLRWDQAAQWIFRDRIAAKCQECGPDRDT